jgi:hypothetical protein
MNAADRLDKDYPLELRRVQESCPHPRWTGWLEDYLARSCGTSWPRAHATTT